VTGKDAVTEAERGAMALTLLKELYLLETQGGRCRCTACLPDYWRRVRELLAAEVPGTGP
jgi:hypothetical protein